MAWSITPAEDGTYDWSCFQSAYGSASGNAPTLPAAKVELAIAEAELFEAPYPDAMKAAMRDDPGRFVLVDYSEGRWASEPRGWVDVIRCVLGLHRAVASGRSGTLWIERCSCGAFGPAPWTFLSRTERRARWRRG